MADISLTLTLGYTGTEFTRKYKFNDLTGEQAAAAKAKILAYNANLPEDDKNIFISDDYDGTIGKLSSIVAAQYETVDYTRIPLN